MTPDQNPFEALGLPARPDLTDEQVLTAWRAIAAAIHPDLPGGGDLATYTAGSAAYAELRTPRARSEAAPTWPTAPPAPGRTRTPHRLRGYVGLEWGWATSELGMRQAGGGWAAGGDAFRG